MANVQVHSVSFVAIPPNPVPSCQFQKDEVFSWALRFQVSEDNMKCVYSRWENPEKKFARNRFCAETIQCDQSPYWGRKTIWLTNLGNVIHIHLRLLTLNHWNLFVLYVKCVFISLRRTLDTKQQSLNGNKTHKYTDAVWFLDSFFIVVGFFFFFDSLLLAILSYAFAHSAILLRLNDSSIYSNILCQAKHKECSLCCVYIRILCSVSSIAKYYMAKWNGTFIPLHYNKMLYSNKVKQRTVNSKRKKLNERQSEEER